MRGTRLLCHALTLLAGTTLAAACEESPTGGCAGDIADARDGADRRDLDWRGTVPTTLASSPADSTVYVNVVFGSDVTTEDRELIRSSGGTVIMELTGSGFDGKVRTEGLLVKFTVRDLRALARSSDATRISSLKLAGFDPTCFAHGGADRRRSVGLA